LISGSDPDCPTPIAQLYSSVFKCIQAPWETRLASRLFRKPAASALPPLPSGSGGCPRRLAGAWGGRASILDGFLILYLQCGHLVP
jgi:hypothetical protein